MAGQISMQAALAACRERMGELVYETVLLRTQIKELEAELEHLRVETPSGPERDVQAPPGPLAGLGSTE
ncbi:hypothetical protein [Streptomyces sp. ME19-01-6]|uniref:hypothetical protein n=1 Tax=Streptomyces sp. ME19-01-6 TaxID=3028686 RepID=UPI0029BAB8C5|nr:hypothetical protein [Streptomyces sp. ME19-01-6]MDX3230640.1 hypothetical protein [Streptomyces sp. ME19-01-6]